MWLVRGGRQLLWLAAGLAGFAGPLHAQGDGSHACFANDSIVVGHRIPPTQAISSSST